MFQDQFDRIALAGHPAEIDQIIKDAWCHHTHGRISENEIEALDEAARTRRDALKARPPLPAPRLPRPGRQRSPDRQASIERRRRLVASGPLPPPLAARFSWGEIAVMRIIGDECRAKGFCDLHIDAIAARAGVHRTTVQNALREAQGKGEVPGLPIILVQERRRAGQRSLTNIIRIVSKEWSDWLRKGPRWPADGVGSNCTTDKKLSPTDTRIIKESDAPGRREAAQGSRKEA
jgi:hypothetical protein